MWGYFVKYCSNLYGNSIIVRLILVYTVVPLTRTHPSWSPGSAFSLILLWLQAEPSRLSFVPHTNQSRLGVFHFFSSHVQVYRIQRKRKHCQSLLGSGENTYFITTQKKNLPSRILYNLFWFFFYSATSPYKLRKKKKSKPKYKIKLKRVDLYKEKWFANTKHK